MMNIKFHSSFSKIILLFLLQLITICCVAQHINKIDDLLQLDYSNSSNIEVTMPYSILANTTYTKDLDVYQYQTYMLKIINSDNPEKIIFQVTKNAFNKHVVSNHATDKQSKEQLPWWSKSAPSILKKLNFSKVTGELAEYSLDKSYRLKLLSKQGHWGKVYALEQVSDNATKTICAVKLLLNRTYKNMTRADFHKRHTTEIKSTILSANLAIAIEPYGIIKNDDDHYLIFLEYGEDAAFRFASQALSVTLEQINALIIDTNKMHLSGYAHGDLTVNNMLFIKNTLKLCDWFSLINFNTEIIEKYRYIGDNLPPEAIRAFYFDKVHDKNIKYALITDEKHKQAYWLHPIAADRFCLGMSILEIIAPDLYKQFDGSAPKNFNPYKPDSLKFWDKAAQAIRNIQQELRDRIKVIDDNKQKVLYAQIIEFIDLDPMRRLML